MNSSTICEMRKILEAMNVKYGGWTHLEIYEDGSGGIFGGDDGVVQNNNKLAEFDGLGELMEILGIGG